MPLEPPVTSPRTLAHAYDLLAEGGWTPLAGGTDLMVRITGETSSRWRREAMSGTTPPYRAWRSACEATTDDRTTPSTSTTAAAVSSQDVSIPRITRRAT